MGLAALLGLVAPGTYAHWTDEASVDGTTFTTGTLDLDVDSGDAFETITLSMVDMVPGSSSAEVLPIANAGTVPLKYTLQGGLAGTHSGDYSTAGSLKLTIVLNGTRSGSGLAATCSAGTTLVSNLSLTSTVTTAVMATPRGPIAPTAGESLCFQVTLDPNAPTGLQGKTATATFTFTGTSDVS